MQADGSFGAEFVNDVLSPRAPSWALRARGIGNEVVLPEAPPELGIGGYPPDGLPETLMGPNMPDGVFETPLQVFPRAPLEAGRRVP